jgi:hypothetical protein
VTLNAPVVALGSPTFTGGGGLAANDSATITVRVYAGTTATGTPVDTRTTTRLALTGLYTVIGKALASGTYTAVASQSDAAGNVGTSAPRTLTVNGLL